LIDRADPPTQQIAALRTEITSIKLTLDQSLAEFTANTPASLSRRISALEQSRTDLVAK
jgi:hypothetical protein